MTLSYLPATLLCDFYKISHKDQYPKMTQMVYSTWTPRASKLEGVTEVVAFGVQKFVKEFLIEFFNDNFFSRPLEDVVNEYTRVIKFTLGVPNPDASHIADLHDLGYLPLEVRALPEGSVVPLRVPTATIHNTDPRFFWLTNYIESLMSAELWGASTSATIAREYRKILNKYARKTAGSTAGVEFQGHDFSFRGMHGLAAATTSGLGHLLSFVGTDTVPAILAAERFYNANIEKELVGTSIPATEHSVMCANGKDELEVYKRLITEVYPSGFVSIVSDTWDFWGVIENVIAPLKDVIMARTGGAIGDRVVIRPDSGDPVLMICGDELADHPLAKKGLIESLWDIFGGTVNEQGYKVLNPKIGAIYGDAITRARAELISERLEKKGFASTNVVYGIGSFTYQYNTRDTFGYALKSTLCQINGVEQAIQKDPKTDDGTKKSALGGVAVFQDRSGLSFILQDGLTLEETDVGELETVFKDGKLVRDEALAEIRARVLKDI